MDNNRQKMVADSTFQLISNAIKYSNPKATVTFALDDANRSLTITDTGCGISAADLPRVFRPFYTGDNGRQRGEATGMGLYLVSLISQNSRLRLRLLLKSVKGLSCN